METEEKEKETESELFIIYSFSPKHKSLSLIRKYYKIGENNKKIELLKYQTISKNVLQDTHQP